MYSPVPNPIKLDYYTAYLLTHLAPQLRKLQKLVESFRNFIVEYSGF